MDTSDSKLFNLCKGQAIPILGWQVFENAKEAKVKISPQSWSDWSRKWEPFAIEITGDAVFLSADSVYVLTHGKSDVEPEFVTKNDATFEAFIVDLFSYKEAVNEDEVDELKAKKKQVKALKKRAPEVVEVYFDAELENIDEYINDKTYEASSDSKHREQGIAFIDTAFKELQKSGKYQDITLGRKDGRFIIFYSLDAGESLERMKEVFANYPTECEIEYIEIK